MVNRLWITNCKEQAIFHLTKNEPNQTFPSDDGEEWLYYVKKRRIDVDADSDGGNERMKGKFQSDVINKDILRNHIKHTRRSKRVSYFVKGVTSSLLQRRRTKNSEQTKFSTNDKMITESLLTSTAYEVTKIVTNGRHYKVFKLETHMTC